ncbi:hypothetical protein B0A48_16177 [Cryoendolithus antarcticus]|uniref:VWFA domain-containing protein n=1 Tax=Cryoendolithus antarcticus TaxID=1507870 RepID=A0A1V8SFF6_9PEZI|nr:hypothetical protein B0A48_16177 [Cryoendolithus antarcticus]
MAVSQTSVQALGNILPLEQHERERILSYARTLPKDDAAAHLQQLLGDSPEAVKFIADFNATQTSSNQGATHHDQKSHVDVKSSLGPAASNDAPPPMYAPPPGLPPPANGAASNGKAGAARTGSGSNRMTGRKHTNPVIEAAYLRAQDEQEMQNLLQTLQYQYGIYNSEIEPEHETDYPCNCPIHKYYWRKWSRYGVQEIWSKAVMYPGEKAYNDNKQQTVFTRNPYIWNVISPYGWRQISWGAPLKPVPGAHAQFIHQTIDLNNKLNREAQANVDSKEPKVNVWDDDALQSAIAGLSVTDEKKPKVDRPRDSKFVLVEKPAAQESTTVPTTDEQPAGKPKASKFSSFRKAVGIKSSDERAVAKVAKSAGKGQTIRDEILEEEDSRWPDAQWRELVATYLEKVGMTKWVSDLRAHKPIQYLHLLRAGYFEPIPVGWATQNSNPLKFSIEAAAGWRGITPAWRGYEDTAEERLYWVMNHRAGSAGTRMKPDFISAMNMARDRMARAVEPPPLYFDATDTCHTQHTSEGYSKQVMPPPFQAYDRPETPSDDTMILLDVSGSMDFNAMRPVYNQYLITQWMRSTQPKNKDVAKAIIRRFVDAMANHDHTGSGYDLITFSDRSTVIGTVNHRNLENMWRNVKLGGGTRVMTGWQKVKELHFQKHSESATYHPVYGWQAGPQTPMLRLLLLLDGEAQDMDEFELDLLGLSWAHVTIFLIGVDGCPHHHRHANELQRISDVNHHVSFVDAQGNTPERYVTHELLKRHLGYDISMREFEEMEELPAYTE